MLKINVLQSLVEKNKLLMHLLKVSARATKPPKKVIRPLRCSKPSDHYLMQNMVLYLPGGQGLRQYVRCHVISRAVDDAYTSRCYHLPNKVVANIDMLGAGMVIVRGGQLDSRLVVAVEGGLREQ